MSGSSPRPISSPNGVPATQYRQTLDELTGLLDLAPLLERPVRNLSLGERMKCEIAVALLHRPQVLFLDEPTIGLDVTMQRRIRAFLAEYNRVHGTTVLLTSHYMADVEALCSRVVMIDHGRILFDGAITVPAEALVGRLTLSRVLLAFGVAAGALAAARFVWTRGLRHYSGASA
jgi:ABC-type uncharacterized transport system ATPase subunit